MKINVCMLLWSQYSPKMYVPPQIGIASYITNFGHSVTWVLSSKDKELQKTQKITFDNVSIFIVPYKYKKNLLNIFSIILCMLKRVYVVLKNFKKEKYNMIFVRNEALDGLLALYIKRRYKIPFILEMSNPIEQSWKMRKLSKKHKYFWYFISKVEEHIQKSLLRKADLVLPISKWLGKDFVKKGIKRSKTMPLPEGVNPSRFSNTNRKKIRKRYKLNDSRVIVYVGKMDKSRQLNVLIHTFLKVKKKRDDTKLLMVGDDGGSGADKLNLEKLVNNLGIKNDVMFTGRVNFNEVPDFIAATDIGISPIPPLDFYKLSSPIKIFEYMAMAKPVVVNEEIPEQKEVIEESGGGILVKFDDESFAEGIVKLLDNPDKAKEMGRKGRKWVIKNRSYEKMAREVEKRYFKILRIETGHRAR